MSPIPLHIQRRIEQRWAARITHQLAIFSRGHFKFTVNPETIGPGEQSSNFFFGTDLLASSATLLLVDANGDFSTFSGQSAVPEPSTWAMMILGFFGVGFMACRRKRNGSSFRPA